MTREEAIKVANEMHGWVKTDREREALETLVPELADSEDEKMRKELIFFLKEEIPQCSIKEHAEKLKAFVSYLEKQKEQKIIPKFKVGDRIYDKRDSYNRSVIREVGKDYYINAFAQKMDMVYTDANFEFLEHLDNDTVTVKPAEWEEVDKNMWTHLNGYLNGFSCSEDAIKQMADWFYELPNRFNLQPKQEWSKEDDFKLGALITDIETRSDLTEAIKIKYVSFLMSLRQQPKQEWSKEDEAHRKFILESLEDHIRFCKKDAEGAYYAKQIRTAQNWLNDLPNKFSSEKNRE